MSPWITREGLYADPLCRMFAAIFLNPLIIALPAWILRRDTTHIGLATKLLFGAGCVYHLNEWLNKWVRNNWTKADDWDWEKELVLITGGSSGIGAGIVQRLAARKIKVVVVDCQPLRFEPGRCFFSPLFPVRGILTLLGEYIHFFKCDLTDDEGWNAVVKEIRQQHGDPTVIGK
jgi:all-trans-retinol dehydrogenase (NAD+)